MAKKDRSTDAAKDKDDKGKDKDREKWLARFQVRLAMQPGVDRAVVLQGVKEVTAHCAETGEDPRTAFGDPDAYAVETAARLVPPERAERDRRHNGVLKAIRSVGRRAEDVAGL
ncbi:hypothetical protein QFZ63_005521 [Streptomyces sp. B3I7]|uniref:hypothetical protein n=1 Tax=Streptomyces sp. B3I7 TaxID=3042269 RepID=UPI00277DD779|nr:hypothetical protein [Streptomyces sp. B3I7]MDQ0813807.1 hypothetical protein [Streptomyces sp. B3I7]